MPLLGKASSTRVKACIALYTRIQLSQPVKPHFFTRTQIPATITFPSFMSKNMFLQQYFKKINKVGKLLQNAPFFSLLFFVAKDWLSIPLVQVSAMRFGQQQNIFQKTYSSGGASSGIWVCTRKRPIRLAKVQKSSITKPKIHLKSNCIEKPTANAVAVAVLTLLAPSIFQFLKIYGLPKTDLSVHKPLTGNTDLIASPM